MSWRTITNRTIRHWAAAGFVVAMLSASAALACPTCKDAIAGDPVARAFSWTTLFMIAMPLTLVASIGGWVAFAHWRARSESPADTMRPADQPWVHAWAGKENET
jgi:hypothetical protein